MKKFLTVFIVVGISIMAVPFVAMIFRPTTETTDNRKQADFPRVTDPKGGLNLGFFTGFENWFKDHFAFRNELIAADAGIQNGIFKVSNVDGVISGKDGWMFYSSTLNDYLGTDRLSDREIYNVAHNLSIAYEYVKNKGSNFVLTIPANKNTLYGENMPYYDSYIVDNVHNVDVLTPLLQDMDIPYADLVKTFKDEEEVLYLKTDSHWNNRGAILAYNTIMDSLGLAHNDYSDVNTRKEKGPSGDLGRMMYTFYGPSEENYWFDIPQDFEYQGNFKSVEDSTIQTTGSGGNGKLLMYRDSFGNTLIPLIANEFSEGYFSKSNVYTLERQMDELSPDTVVFEKVERNIREFITMPPVISAPVFEGVLPGETADGTPEEKPDSTITLKTLEADYDFFEISGEVDKELLENNTDILIELNGTVYKAYHVGDNGFALYLKKETVTLPAVAKVIVTGNITQAVEVKTLDSDETY